jgi:uncharacterized protein (TIGR02145 family)
MASYIKFEYWNDTDLGETLYQFGYHNKLILNIEIEKPDYNTTIEAEQNGDNAPITKFRKLEKVRKWETFVQEDLVDAFKFMALHDNIEITLRSGEVLTVLKHTMVIEHAWEELGCLAKVIGSFVVDYIAAGSCNENFDLGCLCTDPGEFTKIEEFSHLGPAADGTIELAWTVENIAGKKLTADRYQYSTIGGLTWTKLVTEQNTCYENLDDSTVWIFDGQYWQLSPGYISSLVQDSPPNLQTTVKGWVLPGAFCTVWYFDTCGLGWVDAGDYTADELDIGVILSPACGGVLSVKLEVWNHSCDYDFTEETTVNLINVFPKYGLLYNYFAASHADKITSTNDWIVPARADFNALSTQLSGDVVAGGKMKEIGFTYWNNPNTDADNTSAYNGKGAGMRNAFTGAFSSIKTLLTQITSESALTQVHSTHLDFNAAKFETVATYDKKGGFSIRLIKTSTILSDGDEGVYVGNDGKAYRTICIGTQEWLADNLCETKYRNGNDITEVTDPTTWFGLATGALCAYNNDWNNV